MLPLSSISSSPSSAPLADGLNMTVMLHEPPAAKVAPQVLAVIEKSELPEIMMAVISAVA